MKKTFPFLLISLLFTVAVPRAFAESSTNISVESNTGGSSYSSTSSNGTSHSHVEVNGHVIDSDGDVNYNDGNNSVTITNHTGGNSTTSQPTTPPTPTTPPAPTMKPIPTFPDASFFPSDSPSSSPSAEPTTPPSTDQPQGDGFFHQLFDKFFGMFDKIFK
jgi:hypothetical protein